MWYVFHYSGYVFGVQLERKMAQKLYGKHLNTCLIKVRESIMFNDLKKYYSIVLF